MINSSRLVHVSALSTEESEEFNKSSKASANKVENGLGLLQFSLSDI